MFHVNPDLLDRLHSSSHTTLYYRVYTVTPSIINVSLVVKFLLDDEYLVIPFSVCLIFSGFTNLSIFYNLTAWPLNIGNSSSQLTLTPGLLSDPGVFLWRAAVASNEG